MDQIHKNNDRIRFSKTIMIIKLHTLHNVNIDYTVLCLIHLKYMFKKFSQYQVKHLKVYAIRN